jgi:hypothetical protein
MVRGKAIAVTMTMPESAWLVNTALRAKGTEADREAGAQRLWYGTRSGRILIVAGRVPADQALEQ